MSGVVRGFEGVQLVASLYECSNTSLLTDADGVLTAARDAIDAEGLQRLTDCAHAFVEGGGVSVAIVLAESHVAVHTWPEFQAVTLDVYACSYRRDNTAAARRIIDRLVDAFGAQRVVYQEVPRDRGRVFDYIGEAYGVFVDTHATIVDEQSPYQRIELLHTQQFGKMLRLDGRNQCSESEAFIYHEAMVHPVATAHPGPRHVLVLGGGDGGVVAELLRHPSIEHIRVVEIDERIIQIAREHLRAIHDGSFEDPRVELMVGDGAKHVAETSDTFDLILLDLTDEEGPAEALYRPEFLSQCKARLRPGGFLVAHVDAPFGRPSHLRRHYRSMCTVFPIVHVQLIHVPLYGELAMAVCSVDADLLDVPADVIDDRLHHRKITELRCYDGATHHAR
ncbi:MAG TPA: polyamine aminopropyltransferase, partial [Acidimicrobiales bacterium]